VRILITAGVGLIGSHLCESLLSRNGDVIHIGSLLRGAKENLASASPLFRG